MLRELIAFGKAAGAKSEADSERDGFLSYHAESHSAALGLSGGWFAVVQGDMALLSVVYSAAVYGKASGMGDSPKRRRLLRDVAEEPHYALVGAIVGGLLGLFTGQFSGIETRSATEVVEALPL